MKTAQDLREMSAGYHPAAGTERVMVGALRDDLSPRSALDTAHVARLTELDGEWPPLLVHRRTMRIIDGAHRFAAARQLGLRTVIITYFDGTDEEAAVLAISANVAHGLPLSLDDRKRAAAGLLDRHPDWSDRRIAKTCGIAAKTVSRLRPGLDRARSPEAGTSPAVFRLGEDGRLRPRSPGALDAVVTSALAEHPGDSLRAIAERTGASAETVRRIRRRLGTGTGISPCPPPPARSPAWEADNALSSMPSGEAFATWFSRTNVEEAEYGSYVQHIPLSRVYEVIDEVRRRARVWDDFAQDLTRRTRPGARRA